MKSFIHLVLFFSVSTFVHAQLDPGMISIQKEWVQAFNKKDNAEKLSSFYMEKGGLFIENKMIEGAIKSGQVLKELKEVIGQIDNFTSTGAHKLNEKNIFEMGHYSSNNGKTSVASVIAWRKVSGVWKKELEILFVEEKIDHFDTDGIDAARNKWVEISNEQNPEKLVSSLYTENAVYFNGGKVTKGRPDISIRYGYMSMPTWTIALKSLQQIPVRNDLVLEVGEYKSSGRGFYVLVWVKEKDEWNASFDFNF